jgi:hypothetical protein
MMSSHHAEPRSLDLGVLLLEVLEDERRAEATYAAVLDAFGPVRPFVNIIEAERRHAAAVEVQLRRLGLDVPARRSGDPPVAPPTLAEACERAIAAEIENVALFDRVIPQVEDGTVRLVLEALRAASRDRHLPAFRRCFARAGRRGAGRGCRAG